MVQTVTITIDQLMEIDIAARYAQAYLRKIRQWKDGKIELAIEGQDPPYCPDDEELMEEIKRIKTLISQMDKIDRPDPVWDDIDNS